MNAKIINLRTARKQALRRESAKDATRNAARHGRSKAEKEIEEAAERKARDHLDQHKLDE